MPPSSPAYAKPPELADGWLTATPEEIGRTRAPLEKMTAEIQAGTEYRNVHALLIVKDGRLVYENYFTGDDIEHTGRNNSRYTFGRNDKHTLRSMTKSVVSALAGIAVGARKLNSIDTAAYDFFPEFASRRSPAQRAITVRHLLDMSSGLDWNERLSYNDPHNDEIRMNASRDPIRFVLDRPVVAAPGTLWNYGGGSTQLIAEIVQRATNQSIERFANERLWKPLGITDVDWTTIQSGAVSAPAGLHLRPRDQAKIGMLYADSGRWKSQQVIPAAWVNESLRSVIAVPDSIAELGENAVVETGYGHQWWHERVTAPYGHVIAHYAAGNGGQFIYVVPDEHLVVVVNAGNYNQGNDSHLLILERVLPWALGVDSAFHFITPTPFEVATSKSWPVVTLDSSERARYTGSYEYEGKFLRIWDNAGVLNTTTFAGRSSEVLQLAPLGNNVFAFARYNGKELARIYGPNRRLHFRVEGDRVIGFENRTLAGHLIVLAKKNN